jgi:hypothetical protein
MTARTNQPDKIDHDDTGNRKTVQYRDRKDPCCRVADALSPRDIGSLAGTAEPCHSWSQRGMHSQECNDQRGPTARWWHKNHRPGTRSCQLRHAGRNFPGRRCPLQPIAQMSRNTRRRDIAACRKSQWGTHSPQYKHPIPPKVPNWHKNIQPRMALETQTQTDTDFR